MSTSGACYTRDKPVLTTQEGLFISFSSFVHVESLSDNICVVSVLKNLKPLKTAHTRQLPLAGSQSSRHYFAVRAAGTTLLVCFLCFNGLQYYLKAPSVFLHFSITFTASTLRKDNHAREYRQLHGHNKGITCV